MLMKIIEGDCPDNAPEWLKDLHVKGWTVVPGVLSEEKALHYADKGYEWLESWGLGFDRNDPTTRKEDNLPWYIRGGLYARYGLAHEQFVWDLRSEPSLIEKFAMIWGTDELLVSYDGLNLSVPDKAREKDDPAFTPWPHVDQSPYRTNLQCVQGVMNFLPNGPEDGGLMVLEGSKALYADLWKHFEYKVGDKGWNKWERQDLDQDMNDWLVSKGCKWTKVCCNPGDLLLWDSRTVHYGAVPSSTNDRFAAYVCYKPANMVSEETKKERLDVFEKKHGTAHDPGIVRICPRLPPEDHGSYDETVRRGLQNPVLSKRARQLIGLESY